MASAARGAAAGVTAAAVAALVLLALRVLLGGPSLPELVQEWIVQLLPGAVFSFALDRLRFAGKPLLFACILVGQLGVGAGIGAFYTPRARARGSAVVLAVATYAVLGALVLPLLGAGLFGFGRTAAAPLWLSTLLGTVVFVIALDRALRTATAPEPDRFDAERRRVLRLAATGASLGGVVLIGWRALALAPTRGAGPAAPSPPPLAPSPSPGDHVTPEITPVGTFYNVSKNFVDPIVSVESWKVAIGGLVERPFALTLEELKGLPTIEQPATLCCISNEVGGDLIGNAVWKGVRLKDLLQRAGVKSGARKVVFTCRDDYRDSITMDRALQDGTLLVYEMNGAPLTDKHGFPLRVIVPGIYGMKNAKWVERIEVVDSDFQGYWQKQGWSDPAPYQTMSRIDTPVSDSPSRPGEVWVQGIAFAGDRGISTVGVSFDGGATWRQAALRPALGRFTWVRWSTAWTAPPGTLVALKVRATDGRGETQTDVVAEPFPDGATGYHTVRVRVAEA